MVSAARLPASLLRLSVVLAAARAVAFSGSRSVVPQAALCSALPLVPVGCPVFVGCARGVDAFVRQFAPGAVVFQAASFGSGISALVRRSAAMVGAVSVVPGGLLLAFPGCACPPGLVPSRSVSVCFSGFGSGTWASVALAVGLECDVVLWLPSGLEPPLWPGGEWEVMGGGWFRWEFPF